VLHCLTQSKKLLDPFVCCSRASGVAALQRHRSCNRFDGVDQFVSTATADDPDAGVFVMSNVGGCRPRRRVLACVRQSKTMKLRCGR
jgi:hypothetical protein